MINVPTPHNTAKYGDIAKTVLMPGDPLRAKYIAEKYLKNPVCYNEIRGMYGYSGEYKGIRVSVQGSGMGCPSIGIYSKELFDFYGVDNIIRVGSAGALNSDVNIRDVIISEAAYTNSDYIRECNLDDGIAAIYASSTLLEKTNKLAKNSKLKIKFGNIYTSDIFYSSKEKLEVLKNAGMLAVEMETAALYANAILSNKNALSILTVSDRPIIGDGMSAEDRQTSFNEMIEFALELAINC